MSDLVATMLSLGVVASALLIWAGLTAIVKRADERRRGWLMLTAGVVTLVNIWLWSTLPPAG